MPRRKAPPTHPACSGPCWNCGTATLGNPPLKRHHPRTFPTLPVPVMFHLLVGRFLPRRSAS